MSFAEEYRQKLTTAEKAVECVRNGDWVDYSSNVCFPAVLDAALAKRRDELRNVKIRGNLIPGPVAALECDPDMEHFVYNTWHCSGYERKKCAEGRAFFTPMVFRNLAWYYENFLTVDVAMMAVAPADDDGFFSLSAAAGVGKAIADKAKKVIVEVNENLPRITGDRGVKLHISEVDMIVEVGKRPLWIMPTPPPGEIDRKIAAHIFPYLSDGCTVQLGIGGIPNALGMLIADSDLKHLGMHTELASDGYLDNTMKTLHPGTGITGLAIGSERFFEWVNDNPAVTGMPLSYVNDPAVIARNDKMISINGCLNVDLFGQVGSESSGMRQISGTGGQLDFVSGATASRGGRAFLCLPSVYTDREGRAHSTIVPAFTGGDIVTTPRSQAYFIVTENGAVNLAGMSSWERADALISIAHPMFRDELISAAEKQRIWLPSNKR